MKLKYKGINIFFETKGKGKSLILLHGFLHSSTMWKNYSEEWQREFQVVSIDLPGHGKSGVVKDISIEEMAEIVDLILEKLKIQTCTIIGHSMGGYTALAFAELFPDKLKKIILLHSSAYADTAEVKKKRNLWLKIIDKHPAMFVRNVTEFLYSKDNLLKFKNIVEKDIEEAKEVGYAGYAEAIKAMRDRPDRTKVFQSGIPTYIIAGKYDKVIEKDVSEKQMNLIKNGKGDFLENVAHMGFVEDTENCFNLLNEFIKIV